MVRKRDVDDLRIGARLRAGDPLAREAMIRRYLPLARRLAWRYCHTGEPMEDLVQVASLGLVKAVDRWDPDRGFAFTSFAVPTMLGELRRHFRDAGWLVRPPRDLQELALAVERAIGPLSTTLGHAPGAADLAQRLGRSPEAVLEAMQASQGRSARSLDEEAVDDPDDPFPARQRLGREDAGYEAAEARATVERLTRGLDARTREILRLRFEEDLLQRDIAERVGCSQMHVSRILRHALERLQIRAAA